jgi:hypothetical protein
VEQQPVAGLQAGLAADRLGFLQAQRPGRRASRRPHEGGAAHDERFGVPGVDPPQPAGVHVQTGEHNGGELAAGELPGDGGVDLAGDVGRSRALRRACRYAPMATPASTVAGSPCPTASSTSRSAVLPLTA